MSCPELVGALIIAGADGTGPVIQVSGQTRGAGIDGRGAAAQAIVFARAGTREHRVNIRAITAALIDVAGIGEGATG